jgi:response regulator RpfG family c-di-GMP phosphodiesterase
VKLIRRASGAGGERAGSFPGWRVLIVDDDPDIHALTELSLRDFRYDGRGLELLRADSGEAARRLLEHDNDIAAALIDVVMETDDAGLKLVNYIRNDLNNHIIRLVIRTGQPGFAPARQVIEQYDIDDYKDKTELTAQRLYTTIRSVLKAYRDLDAIDRNQRGLKLILSATPSLYLSRPERSGDFFQSAIDRLVELCQLSGWRGGERGVVVEPGSAGAIIACSGRWQDNELEVLGETLVRRQNEGLVVVGRYDPVLGYTPFLCRGRGEHGGEVAFWLEGAITSHHQHQLIELLVAQIDSALSGLRLQEALSTANHQALEMLAEAAEFKDEDTGDHVRRMWRATRTLALYYGLDEESADRFGKASILHDVGKLGVPDAILQKPGRLDPEEFEVIKRHASIGNMLLNRNPWFSLARDCASSHHERWDGGGYPNGLVGEEIPLIGRIVAVIDVFDALAHKRPYKEAWPLERVVEEIRLAAGTQFDPDVVRAFLAMHRDGRLESLV